MAGAAQRIAILGPNWDPDAQKLFIAMTAKPDYRHALACNTFIRGLKLNGLWDAIGYLSGWGALHDAQAFRINWKNPALVGTAVNSPTFAVDGGYTTDGVTTYVDTGYIPAAPMLGASQLIGVYLRNAATVQNTRVAAGSRVNGTRVLAIMPRVTGDAAQAQLNAGAATLGTNADTRGLLVAQSESAGANGRAFKNGAALSAAVALTTPGAVLPNVSVFLGGYNSAGALLSPFAGQFAGLVIGQGDWTAAQHATFYALAQACMTSIGAQV